MTISKPTTRKIKVLTDILSKEREAKGFYKTMAIVFGIMFLIFAYFYANGISAKPSLGINYTALQIYYSSGFINGARCEAGLNLTTQNDICSTFIRRAILNNTDPLESESR